MTAQKRPYSRYTTNELALLVEKNSHDLHVLTAVQYELQFRTRSKAKLLAKKVENYLAKFYQVAAPDQKTAIINKTNIEKKGSKINLEKKHSAMSETDKTSQNTFNEMSDEELYNYFKINKNNRDLVEKIRHIFSVRSTNKAQSAFLEITTWLEAQYAITDNTKEINHINQENKSFIIKIFRKILTIFHSTTRI